MTARVAGHPKGMRRATGSRATRIAWWRAFEKCGANWIHCRPINRRKIDD